MDSKLSLPINLRSNAGIRTRRNPQNLRSLPSRLEAFVEGDGLPGGDLKLLEEVPV